MDQTTRATHTPAPSQATEAKAGPASLPVGRPHVGLRVKAHVPPWVHRQVDALVAGPWGADTRAGVIRDLVIVGLLELERLKVQAPGFGPELAIKEAVRMGEPTATALDAHARAQAKERRKRAKH